MIDFTDNKATVVTGSDYAADHLLAPLPWVKFETSYPCHWSADGGKLLALQTLLPYYALTERAEQETERRRTEPDRIKAAKPAITRLAKEAADERLSELLAKGFRRYEHQIVGIHTMLDGMRLVNADEPGLGKTLQGTLAAYGLNRAAKTHALVLAPKTAISNWQGEVAQIAPELPYNITTWASIPEPLEVPYVVIADEAHLGKAGYRTIRGGKFLRLTGHRNCVGCFPMTGSPSPNGRPMEFWPLLRAVDAPHAYDAAEYLGRALDSMWLYEMNKPYVIRRGRADCPDMPDEPIITLHKVPRNAKAEAAFLDRYNDLRDDYMDRINNRIISDDAWALAMLTHLFHAASLAKADFAVEMAREILAGGDPLVIFAEFKDTCALIAERLSAFGHKVDVLTGAVTSAKARYAAMRRFQSGETDVFVMNQTGGLNITLTRAHDMVMVDRLWVPEDNKQIMRRIDRISQVRQCHIRWIEFDSLSRRKDEVNFWKAQTINQMVEGRKAGLAWIDQPASPAMLLKETFASEPLVS